MFVIGIESSHDDTSIALVNDNYVIFNYKISQTNIHQIYGGTVPEIASREHYNNFYILLNKILKNKHFIKHQKDIEAIAYTENPGLIGALQMGKLFANALSKALDIPAYGINHLHGHIFSSILTNKNTKNSKKIIYPALALVVSGGHSNLYYLKNNNDKVIIGKTLDDAMGEVFDKVARVLNLGFPGGPAIDKIFSENKKNNDFKLNIPKTQNKFDFSFSGFKTQIINLSNLKSNKNKHNEIACSFQKNVVDYVVNIVKNAIKEHSPKTVILSGGVSSNNYLRKCFKLMHKNVLIPEIEYTTDNGAMIAIAYILENKKIKY